MEETIQKMRIVTKEHMDAIEQDLWGAPHKEKSGLTADAPGACLPSGCATDPEADPEKEYPVDASIACLPHISSATRKDYRVYRSDEGTRVTLDTAGVMCNCDAGGNIFKGRPSGKGSGGRPDDVHHLIWNSIRDEAKRRGVPVATVLAEKRAERPGEALTLWRPSEEGESTDAAAAEASVPQPSSDLPSPSLSLIHI